MSGQQEAVANDHPQSPGSTALPKENKGWLKFTGRRIFYLPYIIIGGFSIVLLAGLLPAVIEINARHAALSDLIEPLKDEAVSLSHSFGASSAVTPAVRRDATLDRAVTLATRINDEPILRTLTTIAETVRHPSGSAAQAKKSISASLRLLQASILDLEKRHRQAISRLVTLTLISGIVLAIMSVLAAWFLYHQHFQYLLAPYHRLRRRMKQPETFDAPAAIGATSLLLDLTIDELDIRDRENADLKEQLKQAGDDIDAIKAQVRNAKKVKSELLSMVSHEMRTPMNGVLGMASILKDSVEGKEQQQQIAVIEKCGNMLVEIFKHLIELSKFDTDMVERSNVAFDLYDMLEDLKAHWDEQYSHCKAEFTVNLSPGVPGFLSGDCVRLYRILEMHLADAARSEELTNVSLSISLKGKTATDVDISFILGQLENRQAVTINAEAHREETSIVGVEGVPDVSEKLSFAVIRRTAEAIGGTVSAEIREQDRSMLTLDIPLQLVTPDTLLSAPWNRKRTGETNNLAAARHLRILVAEDNGVNQTVIKAILTKAGHTVDLVENGYEAVSAVIRRSYDVILMDVEMPEMDGLTATNKIRNLTHEIKNVPIIALTANAMTGDRERYLRSGMNDYVSKPIQVEDLFMAIVRCAGTDVARTNAELADLVAPSSAAGAAIEPQENSSALSSFIDSLDELTDGGTELRP